MKEWLLFFLSLPIVAAGFLFEFCCDMFDRGRAAYDWFTAE